MLRNFFIIYAFLVLALVSTMGLRGCKSERTPLELFPDMDRQPKLHPQGTNDFFKDGRSDRPRVPGTVPTIDTMGETYAHLVPPDQFHEDDYFATGRNAEGDFGSGFPIEVTFEAMQSGAQNYELFCTVCHGRTGDGNGVLKNARYGYATIASLLQNRLVEQPEGEMFNTITWGKNTMGPYGLKLRPEERWEVILYVRALQRASSATVEDVPAMHRGDLGL